MRKNNDVSEEENFEIIICIELSQRTELGGTGNLVEIAKPHNTIWIKCE